MTSHSKDVGAFEPKIQAQRQLNRVRELLSGAYPSGVLSETMDLPSLATQLVEDYKRLAFLVEEIGNVLICAKPGSDQALLIEIKRLLWDAQKHLPSN